MNLCLRLQATLDAVLHSLETQLSRATRGCWRVALPCLMVAGAVQPAASQQLNQFVGFGDSSVDTGWFKTDTTGFKNADDVLKDAVANKGANGKFIDPGGLRAAEVIAAYFNLPGTDPANAGGSNYASGGARGALDNLTGSGIFPGAVSLRRQIDNYLTDNHTVANPNALYVVGIGGNDVAYALNQQRTDGQFPLFPLGSQAAKDYLVNQATAAALDIARLQAAGARYIIVPNLAEEIGGKTAREYREIYNDTLWGTLAAKHVNFIPSDTNAVRVAIQKDFESGTKSFGLQFIDNAHPACKNPPAGTPFHNGAFSLICGPSDLVAPDAGQTHLFADGTHLSTAGHKILSDYTYSLVVAPGQLSYLPETAVKTRTRLVSSIQTQIGATQQQPTGPQGFHFWATGDVSSLQMDNAPGFSDTSSAPSAVVAGLSFRSGILTFGGAVSAGHLNSGFGSRFGHFDQDEVAVSALAALRDKSWWGTLVGSYGLLDYDVNRLVPVGITVQRNVGRTDGQNVSLAAQAGFDFRHGIVTHGPVAGVTLQRIDVHGFTETGSFTSLAFDSQTRDSAISALGWRATLDLGMFRPFGQLVWNHELASTDRNVTASLTTIAAPSYALPAVVLGKDWGTATVGTNVILGPGVTAVAAFSTDFSQSDVVTCGAQIGISVGF